MNEYNHRLSTFDAWPSSAAVNPLLLAKCGFYYTGRDDTVCCYRCSTTLNQWRPGDDPLVRHRTTNPVCPVATDTDTLNAGVVRPSSRGLRRPLGSLEEDLTRPVRRSSPDELSWQHFRMFSVRLATFRGWPMHHVVSAGSLARAGFFYTGYDDRVRCAFCRREFYDWQPGDVPTDEHRRGVPSCPFVRQNFCSPAPLETPAPQQHVGEQVCIHIASYTASTQPAAHISCRRSVLLLFIG